MAGRVRLTTVAGSVGLLLALAASPAGAQDISINLGQGGGGGGLTERVIQLIALLTVLSLAPSILVMMTSFTRIVVVLSLLRARFPWCCARSPMSCWSARKRH
jgi:flagellar biosynthetic protein FliP